VTAERRLSLLARLASGSPDLQTKELCDACAEIIGMSGAGIMLMSSETPGGSVGTTNEVSVLIEQLQYTLGEGPCVDAYHQDRPVLEPDLAEPAIVRWLAFTGPAVQAGVRAVFGFPLQVGEARLGTLNLYCDQPGALTDLQHGDALVMAGVTAQAILVMQASAPPGRLAAELEAGGNFQYAVHQAAGMVSSNLGIAIGEALIRLRAYAFGNDRPLAEVANDIVARRLSFDDGT
jgi:hypothetical protein